LGDRAILHVHRGVTLIVLLTIGVCGTAVGQEPERTQAADELHRTKASAPDSTSVKPAIASPPDEFSQISDGSLRRLPKDLLQDQKEIWTSPSRLRLSDTQWLLPLSGLGAAFFVTDASFSRHLSQAPSTINHYKTASTLGVGALLGGAAGMWALGQFKHNTHWSETGFLAGEAALNSLAVVESLKYTLRRERPFQTSGGGAFFQGGTSFPSEHAAAAWSAAGVIAHEYPGLFTKVAAYGLASFVSFSRVRARQHFPSDVLVGSVIGNLIAQDVYSRRHDPELGGEAWRSISSVVREVSGSAPRYPASPYVPLDSWVYPAIERLAAQGFIDSAFLQSRPWTRIECARLVQEAEDRLGPAQDSPWEAERVYEALYTEFHHDLDAFESGGENVAKVESLYTNFTEIVGRPLNDSDHFGQTIINNFGRPYQQGFNSAEGFSAWAADGRFSIYVRGEYQHAPGAAGFSQSTQNLIGFLDANPVVTASAIPATNQFRLLDTYVSTSLGGWNLAFGKQSLWLGEGNGGALLFSNNAEPIYMFRASRVVPLSIPWIGPVKVDAFIGKLSGNVFPPTPVIHGETVSFKPTKNLELGFTRIAELGGAAIPGITPVPVTTKGCAFGTQRALTAAALFHSYFSFQESDTFGCNNSPGKRTAGFQMSYRVPFLRDWLTVYTDSLSPDDVSPVSAPRRAAIQPGLYLSHFPKLAKLDLRVEAVNTDTPSSSVSGVYVYFDFYYHNLSTVKNNLIGSWIGRNGKGIQAWSTYWFNGRSSLQFGYRHAQVAGDFIPHGETFNDASVRANWSVRRNLEVSASAQYERWFAPVLAPGPQVNWTSSVQISYTPHGWSMPFRSSRPQRDQENRSTDGGADQ